MAEVSIDPLITPKEDEMDVGSVSKSSSVDQDALSNGRSASTRPRRKSVGSNHAGDSALRSSAEKSESASSSQKLVPHYLRASTGSCHDFCKFGREHSFETKARKPFRKRIGKTFPNELSPIQILVSGGRKKEEVVSDEKEELISGIKKEEEVSGKKEEAISGDTKKEEAILGGKKEKVISGGKKKEKVVSDVKNKEEVISDGKKKRDLVELQKGKVVSGGRKKEEIVSDDHKKEEVVSAEQKNEEVGSAEQKKEEVVSIGEKTEVAVDHGTPTDTTEYLAYEKASIDTKSCPAKLETSLDKEKATVCKPSTFTKKHPPNVPSSQNKLILLKLKLSSYAKTYSSKKNGSSGNENRLLKQKPSSAKKSPSADPPEIVKSVIFPYTEVADSVKQGSSSDNKTSGTVKKTASVAKQQSNPVKLKPVKVKSSPSDDSNGMHGKGGRNINAETGRKVIMAFKSSEKKISAPPPTLTSKLSSNKTAQVKSGKPEELRIISSLKDRSWIRRASSNKASNGEKVSEKTLHVIRMKTGNDLSKCISGDNAISSSHPSPSSAKPLPDGKSSSLLSPEEDNSESAAIDVEANALISENNVSLETNKEEAVKRKIMRKIRVVPEDKHTSPVKLKFKMGKVVDLQSDSNTPRKLRFRRARLLAAEDIKGDSRRKTSKRTGINVDTASTGNPTQRVVLKHQDVQGKKNEVLLNNVIEETASKLAVSRKSKVKALVGAFETVISLQEIKPSTQVVS